MFYTNWRSQNMDINRKAYDYLIKWKNSTSTAKALLIKGARRVGKSYIAEKFGKNEYKSYILIDFASPRAGTIKVFEKYGNRENLTEFFNQLSVLYETVLYERNSLFIFDEVQKYPKARELVKYLVADGRYDYIETGSLISIRKNVKDIVIPSEEEEMKLYPFDFEEFLNALNDYTTVPYLKKAYENTQPLGNLLKPVMDKFRQYMIVGGMPQAVVEYIASGNVDRVESVKRGILKLYREDIAKYADSYVAEATAVFNSIPSQLSHHDKKIKYSSLSEGDRFSSYRDAVHWIEDSMVGNMAVATDSPEYFGEFELKTSKLKCYMADTGLLLTLAAGNNYLKNELYKSFIAGKLSTNKGMMTENMVAQMLMANGHDLRFYERIIEIEGKKKKYEVDFLVREDEKVTPIEVKSGNNSMHSSIDYYCRTYRKNTNKGIILTKGDLRMTDDYNYLPLPMTMFL